MRIKEPDNVNNLKGDHKRKHVRDVVAPSGQPLKPTQITNDAVASIAWDEAVEDLAQLNLLSKVDSKILELYSSSYSLFVETSEVLRQNPANTSLHKLRKTYADDTHKYLLQLGLTPFQRCKMRVSAKEVESKKWLGIINNAE